MLDRACQYVALRVNRGGVRDPAHQRAPLHDDSSVAGATGSASIGVGLELALSTDDSELVREEAG